MFFNKEGCVPMVIWSEFRVGQYKDDSHREDAPHFTYRVLKDFQIDLNEEFEMEWYPTELRLNQLVLVYLFAYQHPK